MTRTLLQQALAALDNLGSMSDRDVTPYAWHGAKAEQACTALRSALAAPMPEPWMPIETAPKDGSMFLIWVDGVVYGEDDEGQRFQQEESQVDFAQWRATDDGGYLDCFGYPYPYDQGGATHWMPLPAAPGATPPAVPAPCDMVMVPREPTIAMCLAGDGARHNVDDATRSPAVYRAMIAAAPPAAPAPVVPDGVVQVPWSPQSAVLDTPAVRCPTCYGDDMQTPCAYPEGGQPGCLRDKWLSAAPVVPDETPAEEVLRSLASYLGAGGYNAPTVDAEVFKEKILWGIDNAIKSAVAQSAAPVVPHPDEFTCPYCFDQGAAPVVPDIANPITDEQIIEAASNWDCGTRHENEEWAFKRPRELLQFARAVLALSATPVVREPLKPWEFVAMWATAAKKHTDTYDTAVEFGRAVEAHHGITGGGK